MDDVLNEVSIEPLCSLIRISETALRYEDMCVFTKKLIQLKSKKGQDLDVEQRYLFVTAYKKAVQQRISSWRTIYGGFILSDNDDIHLDETLLNKYKQIIANEIQSICKNAIYLTRTHLCKINLLTGTEIDLLCNGYIRQYGQLNGIIIPFEIIDLFGIYFEYDCCSINNGHKQYYTESEAYYLKNCADHFRWICEMNDKQIHRNTTERYYSKALQIAEAVLMADHPTRLEIALDFSVCCYEILKKPEKACDIAFKAFIDAIEVPDSLGGPCYKDSGLIMQLLRDNWTLWTN